MNTPTDTEIEVNWDHTWKTKTGFGMMVTSILGFCLAVLLINDEGWRSWTMIGMILIGATGLVAYMWPTVEPHNRVRSAKEIAGIAAFMISIVLVMHLFVLPEYI